ncbi:GDP-mannose 4,6-dehydratase [Ruegeria marina]|uniref:dTDP-glucose 4,6-dehydratase n=1 Tax=Ruegeria marina TaxID=639004 RepID=A0A1G6VKT6_9RHOB|nr:GDP-mannose 4,6-dehydratase [Ruegeria marina]SDD54141.1 dTDP-glucose 4,6-dehydratase [Ruegeria marina]
MNWPGKRVVVTGGAGFIGSHLSERLVAAGASVTVFTRYTSNGIQGALRDVAPEVFDAITIVAGDLRDGFGVEAAISGADVVFHLAAHIGIPYSYVHPIDVVQVNMEGTANVLEACRRQSVSKVVVFSTSETYGTAQYVPIDERHPMNPQSPYAASKVGADQLALAYARSFDLPVAICRPFNTYGPRQPARAVLPTIIAQALTGDVIKLGSLTPTRDLVYVGDTAYGAMRIAEEDATIGKVINLATGCEVSIGDLAHSVIDLLGGGKRIETDQRRIRPEKSEVMQLLGDATLARDLLGWTPSVTLSEGLDHTISWVRRNSDLFDSSGYRI